MPQEICIYCKGTRFHGDEFTGGESYCRCPAGRELQEAEKKPGKPTCSNCGKKHPQIVFHEGKWYCPGACDVTRGKRVAG